MLQERAGAASGIKYTDALQDCTGPDRIDSTPNGGLQPPVVQHLLDDHVGQPVRGVILTEEMPIRWCREGFIELTQNIPLGRRQS